MVMGTLGIYTEMAKGEENGKRVSRLRWFALGCLAGVTGGVGDLCDWVAREWDRQRADRNLLGDLEAASERPLCVCSAAAQADLQAREGAWVFGCWT